MKVLKHKRTKIEFLNSQLNQNWLLSWDNYQRCYKDQYGSIIVIHSQLGNYELFHKGETLIKTFSLNAAKEISRIYLNDLIANSQREPRPQDSKAKK